MQLTTNLIVQYILVGLTLLGVAVWVIWKILEIRKDNTRSACSCCEISKSCAKKGIVQKHNMIRP